MQKYRLANKLLVIKPWNQLINNFFLLLTIVKVKIRLFNTVTKCQLQNTSDTFNIKNELLKMWDLATKF